MLMNYRILTILICLILGFNQNLKACSFTPDSFCHTANVSRSNDLIVMATISQIDTLGIDVNIIQILRGQESNSSIRIWDGTDFDCNGIHSMAASDIGNLNDTLILLLPKIDSLENDWDVIGDYRRPEPYTSTTSLKVSQGFVNGLIIGIVFFPSNGINSLALNDFLATSVDEMGCATILSNEELDTKQLKVYPNPTKDFLSISGKNFSPETKFKIINTGGQILKIFTLDNGNQRIDISNFRPGLYAILSEHSKIIYFVKS